MGNNPYLDRIHLRPKGGHGNKSEKRLALTLGARLQPASGAMDGAKSDFKLQVSGRKFRGEAKSTISGTIPLDLQWLAKISKESMSDGSIPILTLSFVMPDGKPRDVLNPDWVCMPMQFFQELLESGK